MNNTIINMTKDWTKTSDRLPDHKGNYAIRWIDKNGKDRVDVAFFRKSDDKKYYWKDGKRVYSRTKESGWTGNFADKEVIAWKDVE